VHVRRWYLPKESRETLIAKTVLCVHAPRTLLPYSMHAHSIMAALLMGSQQTTLHEPSW
jgi:hypothetical protein